MKFNTRAIHGGQDKIDPAYDSVMPPIYQTSTFAQESPGKNKGFAYARSGNPTRQALERSLASLEGGEYGMAFSSGVAAIDAVLKLLSPGDAVLCTADLYGGSHRLFTQIYKPLGIEFKFVDMGNPDVVEEAIGKRVKLIWIETPTNPMMNIVDIKAITSRLGTQKIWVAVDNTFATPYLQQPLSLGADIVMHSATKYLAGHSDVILGGLVVNDIMLSDRLQFIQKSCGAVPGPQDCFLTLRGIKTLPLRMDRHCENGAAVAQFLEEQEVVDSVYWPGLEHHPGHGVAGLQMSGFGGMVSFDLKDNRQAVAFKFLEKLQLFTLAESLGGVESLAGHPATMTHASIPREDRVAQGITDSLIRLSVGVEDVGDLMEDLQQAFDSLYTHHHLC
ncbi:MAG: PLP-dependent aspartate aminotransferase family protein [Nonlabens sp.]